MSTIMTTSCPIQQIEKLEYAAKEFGFYWENILQIIEQIRSECEEVIDAHDNNNIPHLQEEIGDLIHATLSLAVFCKLDPHQTLQMSIEKFQKRYAHLVSLVQKDGLKTLHGKTMQELLHYWQLAKQKETQFMR